MRQSAPAVLMVRPTHFFVDPETAASNKLQPPEQVGRRDLLAAVLVEFDNVAAALTSAGVTVCQVEAAVDPPLPDAVFPNNWFSTHDDGTFVLYPMLAQRRRLERRPAIVRARLERDGFKLSRTIDLTQLELAHEYVEGTGSLVLDRLNFLAFASLSPRTTVGGVRAASLALGYRPVTFNAQHADGSPIYHTNVMLSVGTTFAIGCFDAIAHPNERAEVLAALQQSGRSIISLSLRQMLGFAANCLELAAGEHPVVVFSTRAWAALEPQQRLLFERTAQICTVNIGSIERSGGGGVRCMLAEIFLPRPTSSLSLP